MKKLKLEELGRLTTEEYKTAEKSGISLLLDNVRSMHNVGSAFRTSDAFLIDTIYLGGITARPPHREIHKTALGAQDTVNWEYHPDTTALAKKLISEGKKLIAVEQADQSISLHNYQAIANQEYVLVFGNEVEGVSDELIDLCETCIEIPQFGTKHSLNVSVSLGILAWEFIKQTKLSLT